MSEHVCGKCKGSGRTAGPVHINRGDQPHEWVDSLPCFYCDGVGRVNDDKFAALQLGEHFRKQRIARGESVFEASKRLGLSPAELSGLERGKGGMAAWLHPFATRAYLEATAPTPSPTGTQ